MAPERLTALDASFLYLERPAMHMHVGGLAVFDPSTRPDRRLAFREIEEIVRQRIHLVPRFRQRIMEVPFHAGLPVWVDDEHFDLDFHVRRSALPRPGGRTELTTAVQRVLSRPLDRTKPLWELYVIEGLEGGFVATLTKVHHAMIDGMTGMQLAMGFYDLVPQIPEPKQAPDWSPEPAPSARDLLRRTVGEQLQHPLSSAVDAASTLVSQPVLSGLRGIFGMGARPASPFNVQIGPNRRFAITEAPLERYKEIKNALGGSVNDVVLAAVWGAAHRVLTERREPTKDKTLRVMVPVSVRSDGDAAGAAGNRIAPAFVDVPVGRMGPKRRLAIVREGTQNFKETMMAMGADAIIGLGTYAPGGLLAAAARAASRGPWFNLVVSNIPGPQVPLYLGGARLVANYPAMPLGENSALSIACTSLSGTMAFGLTADWDAMPDLDQLALAMEGSLDELSKAAGV